MPSFKVNVTMQYAWQTMKANDIIEISKEQLELEIAKGKHRNGKWNSGLLNHCTPDDEETRKLCEGLDLPKEKPELTEEEKQEAIDAIKKEMDEIGAGYDNRWGLKRMQNELVKAKKEKGV